METQNETPAPLSIFCIDRVVVEDRATTDIIMVQDVQVTFWMNDRNIKERIESAFDILFEEVVKTRVMNRSG